MTTSGTTSDSEWQRVIQKVTTSGMDDCHPFNDKNRYTTTSRGGWLQLEWLNK